MNWKKIIPHLEQIECGNAKSVHFFSLGKLQKDGLVEIVDLGEIDFTAEESSIRRMAELPRFVWQLTEEGKRCLNQHRAMQALHPGYLSEKAQPNTRGNA